MDYQQLELFIPNKVDLSPYHFGIPQQSGAMTVVPIFSPDCPGQFTSPLSGLKLSRVHGYGNVELHNPSTGVAIVPLHMGYIQDQAQNHALCRSAFIAAGQKLMFKDACCVQSGQGGYLEGREQWFFILPLQLRFQALKLRGQEDYSKLWKEIERLNQRFDLPQRGHLEQILSKKRTFLTQYQSRFELLPQQTGALFLIRNQLVGVEIAPTAAYFREVWMPLVCFCYGVAAMYAQKHAKASDKPVLPFAATNLQELRQQLHKSRQEKQLQVSNWLSQTPAERFQLKEEERFLSLRLHTCKGKNFAGQLVEESGQLVYASLFASAI